MVLVGSEWVISNGEREDRIKCWREARVVLGREIRRDGPEEEARLWSLLGGERAVSGAEDEKPAPVGVARM